MVVLLHVTPAMDTGHGVISTGILSLPPIYVGKLSHTDEIYVHWLRRAKHVQGQCG